MNNSSIRIDSLLDPLLLAASDEQADVVLQSLIDNHAQPLIKSIIRYKIHISAQQPVQRAEAEDVYQDALVQLLHELKQLRQAPDVHPISDFRAIVAVITHRTCSRWMRRQFPERHSLKNRLYYLLTRQRGLALWKDEAGKVVAGFAVWQGQKKTLSATQLAASLSDERQTARVRFSVGANAQKLAPTLQAVLDVIGAPVEFDALVGALATHLEIRDQPMESIDNSTTIATAQTPDVAWQVEKRFFLQRLWDELQQLPIKQRAALLLNLKDTDGGGCIGLFPASGIASVRQIAEALEMKAEELAELWNQLPMEDAKIAGLLAMTRQQVINARKSGRERLARRLKGFI